MGIHGLWQLVEPAGRPVDIHSLRGKVLAIDVSIWLHQLVKGFRDKDGNPLPNAHLLGVFHRVCKLLNYGIKPVFVFDGGVPVLKRQTLAARRSRKLESLDKAEANRQRILRTYLEQQIQRTAMQALPRSIRMEKGIAQLAGRGSKSPSVSPKKKVRNESVVASSGDVDEDLENFRAALVAKLEDDVDEVDPKNRKHDAEDEKVTFESNYYGVDYFENFNVIQSSDFDTLPLETQHEILYEMQESRKLNSWGKFDQMPKDLPTFSSYQMDRLVKRRALQKKIQSVQKEMGQRHIHVQNLDELFKMNYEGYADKGKETQVIGSKDDGFVLIKSQEVKKGKEESETEPKPGTSSGGSKTKPQIITIDDFAEDSSSEDEGKRKIAQVKGKQSNKVNSRSDEEDEEMNLAIQLSLETFSAKEKEQQAVRNSSEEAEEGHNETASMEAIECNRNVITVDDFRESCSRDDEASKKHWKPMEISRNQSAMKSKRLEEEDENLKLAMQLSLLEAKENKGKEEDSGKVQEGQRETPKMDMGSQEKGRNVDPLESFQSSEEMVRCAKFLDVIGIRVPMAHSTSSSATKLKQAQLSTSSAPTSIKQMFEVKSSESEEEDFEDVEELEGPSQSNIISSFSESKPNRDGGITIDLTAIQKAPMNGEDIFADIFGSKGSDTEDNVDIEKQSVIEKKAAQKFPGVVKSQSLNKENSDVNVKSDGECEGIQTQEEVDIKWDSDSDIEADLLKMVMEESAKHEASRSRQASLEPSSSTSINSEEAASRHEKMGENEKDDSVRMITAEYMQAQAQLNSKLDRLQSERGFQERVSTSISDQMQIETQELISLFGIPYVVSPTEAESQCAFLDRACLTEGCITDDSDVWLFGGQRIYKNFFSQGQKRTEFYQAADVQRVLNLNREKLIVLAMMIGNDYSDGIHGVGAVMALEILSEFSSSDIEDSFEVLVKFKDWWEETQEKRSDVFSGSKLKERLRKLKLGPGFPDRAVYEAFINPSIDTSTERFKWGYGITKIAVEKALKFFLGNPDLDAIRGYTKQKFGWEQTKCDSLLLPVLKNLRCEVEQSRQLTLDSYLCFGKMPSLQSGKRKKGSKRIQTAVKKLKRVGVESHELKLSSEDSSNSEGEEQEKRKPQLPQSSTPRPATQRSSSSSSGKRGTRGVQRKEEKSQDDQITVPSPSLRAVARPKTASKGEVIPQRVQSESDKMKNKQKAIEIFKKRKQT